MKLSVFEEVSVFFFEDLCLQKVVILRVFARLVKKKKTGSRSRVCNEVNIGIPLHWSGCFLLLIQCSYGVTVYFKLKVWFLVCWLIWTAKFEYNELKNRPITKKGLSFFKLLIKETVHFGSVTISLPLVYWELRNHPCENYALRWTLLTMLRWTMLRWQRSDQTGLLETFTIMFISFRSTLSNSHDHEVNISIFIKEFFNKQLNWKKWAWFIKIPLTKGIIHSFQHFNFLPKNTEKLINLLVNQFDVSEAIIECFLFFSFS